MYTKDKACRITLRLNEEQFSFVKDQADTLGVSPSDFLRMVVNVSMASTKMAEKKLSEKTPELIKNLQEATGRENDKANFDNQL